MEFSRFTEMAPDKLFAGIVGLFTLMAFGMIMAFVMGPSVVDGQEAHMQQEKLRLMTLHQDMMDRAKWEASTSLSSEDVVHSMSFYQ